MRHELILKRRFWKTRERHRVHRDLGADWRHVDARLPKRARFSLLTMGYTDNDMARTS